MDSTPDTLKKFLGRLCLYFKYNMLWVLQLRCRKAGMGNQKSTSKQLHFLYVILFQCKI